VAAPGLFFFAITCFIGALFGLWLFSYSWRIPMRDPRPMPRLVYWSFTVFVIALVIAGGSLVFKTPSILPWVVTPELSVLFGWMFLGAAVYFTYGLLRPSWSNAAGQLAGFLVYDFVLLLPFIQRTPNLPEHFVVSQIIYLIVVIYSGLLATYYLLINPDTRLFGSRRLVPA
jgi:hypothetical protein